MRLPRSARDEMLFLTPEEVLALAGVIAPPPYGVLVAFAAYTGLRAGEVGALRVGRLDLLRGTADVAESLADVKGGPVFGPTKTYARRVVRLPRFLIAQGARPKAILECLGHSSIQVTLDRYGHLLPGLDEALTDGLEATYRQALAGFSRDRGRVASVATTAGRQETQ